MPFSLSSCHWFLGTSISHFRLAEADVYIMTLLICRKKYGATNSYHVSIVQQFNQKIYATRRRQLTHSATRPKFTAPRTTPHIIQIRQILIIFKPHASTNHIYLQIIRIRRCWQYNITLSKVTWSSHVIDRIHNPPCRKRSFPKRRSDKISYEDQNAKKR